MSDERNVITASEFRLVDSDGKVCATLSADGAGFSALKFFDPKNQNVKVEVSLDDKGSHFWLAGEEKQQSYLFLKNDGASGVVLFDKSGNRRAEVMIDATGVPRVRVQTPGEDSREL